MTRMTLEGDSKFDSIEISDGPTYRADRDTIVPTVTLKLEGRFGHGSFNVSQETFEKMAMMFARLRFSSLLKIEVPK